MTYKILAVEDSATQAEHLRALLEEAGHDVTLARSGEDALDRLEGSEFDLVLSDVMMPGISGYDLCARVKRERPGLPVVLLTSLSSPMDIVRGLESGGDNYITKPYDADHLLARVRRVLDNRHLRKGVRTTMGVNITFLGNTFTITSEREQILDLLLSSVEDTVRANTELEERQRELADAHARLEMYATEQAREARRSTEQYRVLMRRAGDAIFVLDHNGTVVEANECAAELLGRPLEQALYHDFQAFLDPTGHEDRPVEQRSVAGLAGGAAERALKRPDGDVVWVELSTSTTDLEGEPFTLVIARDVTERRQKDETLRSALAARQESEEKLQTIFAASPIGIVVLGLEDTVQIWNPAAERIFGWSAEEAVGAPLPYLDLSDPETREQSAALTSRVLSGEMISGLEARRPRRDGDTLDLSMSAAPLRRHDGIIDGVVMMFTDISQRKRNEEALRRSEEELRHSQRLDAIGRLSGGVAHDFNNILTTIQGSTQLLLMDLPPDSDIRQELQEIDGAAARATGLTRQLLAFSRKQVFQPRVLDVNAVVKEMEGMLHRLSGERVKLRLDLDPEILRVRADLSQIQQVVMNLAVNARDAMSGSDGTITIITRNADAEEAELPELAVRLSVQDTGGGIPEEIREQIFEPFFTTKGKKGTGLGLSTVYGIVKQSGGTIRVESARGQGTRFDLYLPCVGEAADPIETAGSSEPLQGRETILVVEDEEAVRKLAVRILEKQGYTVFDAPTGEAALDLLDRESVPLDLLVTDLMMPGMGGAELAAAVAAERPDMPVLYMSGYTDDTIVEQGILKPGVWLLEKPFTPHSFVQRIREVLESGSAGPR